MKAIFNVSEFTPRNVRSLPTMWDDLGQWAKIDTNYFQICLNKKKYELGTKETLGQKK